MKDNFPDTEPAQFKQDKASQQDTASAINTACEIVATLNRHNLNTDERVLADRAWVYLDRLRVVFRDKVSNPGQPAKEFPWQVKGPDMYLKGDGRIGVLDRMTPDERKALESAINPFARPIIKTGQEAK